MLFFLKYNLFGFYFCPSIILYLKFNFSFSDINVNIYCYYMTSVIVYISVFNTLADGVKHSVNTCDFRVVDVTLCKSQYALCVLITISVKLQYQYLLFYFSEFFAEHRYGFGSWHVPVNLGTAHILYVSDQSEIMGRDKSWLFPIYDRNFTGKIITCSFAFGLLSNWSFTANFVLLWFCLLTEIFGLLPKRRLRRISVFLRRTELFLITLFVYLFNSHRSLFWYFKYFCSIILILIIIRIFWF